MKIFEKFTSVKAISFINTLIADFAIDIAIAVLIATESGSITLAVISTIFTATARIYVKKMTNNTVSKLKELKSKKA